jgi:hypothetical protein
MRLLALAVTLAGSGLIAQSPTGFGRLSNPSGIPPSQAGAGFGRLIYSGTGGPPAARRPGFAPVPGRPLVPPSIAHPYHNNAVIVPYPVFYGGYYYPYDAPLAPPQGYEGDYGYSQQQPAPVVILNQNFRPDTGYPNGPYGSAPPPPPPAPDQSQSQTPPQTQAGDSASIIFLIAMKDHTIFPAVAYWVEGDTLNYITAQGVRNKVSLDLVDREFSKQLNKERSLDFALPGN